MVSNIAFVVMIVLTSDVHFPLANMQEEMRETTADDFRYEDLERLPTEELARITEWLTEKVDALSTRLKAEPKEDEVRGRGFHLNLKFKIQGWAAEMGAPGLLESHLLASYLLCVIKDDEGARGRR
jgi:hypothetical protein